MHIHILGICGTFMGSLAVLAKQLGHQVSGCDANVYPPMSTQLEQQGIQLIEGFDSEQLSPQPDLVVIGNAMSRGNPCVEYVLNEGMNYCSGPEWLARFVLKERWVLAVAGTHGKTTTSSMLAWILEYAGLKPGYLIGGVLQNFSTSAALGDSPFFVVEADEYDCAFFDKRSKFVHYGPRTAILNNLEFDHADIFDDLDAIKKQFHHLVRTVPGNGLILAPTNDSNINDVLALGSWSPEQRYGIDSNGQWNATLLSADGSCFQVSKNTDSTSASVARHAGEVSWNQTGDHSVNNALAAVAAAHHVGVDVPTACEALSLFKGVKRRMELLADINGIKIYDDFAHHPTAIATTLAGMAKSMALGVGRSNKRLIAVIEPRSNTMKMGIHQQALAQSCSVADLVLWREPESSGLDIATVIADSGVPGQLFAEVENIVSFLVSEAKPGDHIVIMSNGGFEGIHNKLITAFESY